MHVIQDLFPKKRTIAHVSAGVFIPGKDGTFTNAERRFSRYARLERWRVSPTGNHLAAVERTGYPMSTRIVAIMDEIAL